MIGMGIDYVVARCTAVLLLGAYISPAEMPPADPVALVREGRRMLNSGQPEQAAADFQKVLDNMQAQGQPASETLPAIIALSTAWLSAGNYSRAEGALMLGNSVSIASSNDLDKAELTNNWAMLHLKLGHTSQARAELLQALGVTERSAGGQRVTPRILDDLTVVEIRLGQYSQALLHQQEAIERWRTLVPAESPILIKSFVGVSVAQFFSGQLEAARLSLDSVIQACRRVYGEKSPMLGRLLRFDAVVLSRLSMKTEARAREREASHIAADRLPSDLSSFTRAAIATAMP